MRVDTKRVDRARAAGAISPAEAGAAPARRGRGRPFRPGQSGNPAGKPKGTRNRVTLMLEALLAGEAEEIARKAIALAKAGDSRALKACFDRLLPPRRDRAIAFSFPDVATVAD